ncbi:DMT family transporter [Brevibacillus fluminis]|uniref:DMT family transporter n=1 Tax=Brevibacillus fluminis TaxID=511487 RepID=A0A3M8D2S9_9BACL|nr:DMT family transporter [Brevibacillus fluminis]RNB82390.1 DMT family transporter [Brevibacillus fluminis]
MLYISLALIIGVLIIFSMIINSHLARRIGVLQGTWINYLVGLAGSAVLLFAVGDGLVIAGIPWEIIPFWAYFGGAVGVLIVALSNIVIPTIPAIYSTLLMFVGQLFASMLIDYTVGHPITVGKIVGGLLILGSMLYNFFNDKKAAATAVDHKKEFSVQA